jgi:hypothetical protein
MQIEKRGAKCLKQKFTSEFQKSLFSLNMNRKKYVEVSFKQDKVVWGCGQHYYIK